MVPAVTMEPDVEKVELEIIETKADSESADHIADRSVTVGHTEGFNAPQVCAFRWDPVCPHAIRTVVLP